MSSRAVVLGTAVDNDVDAFMKHVSMVPNFIDIEIGREHVYTRYLEHPEWLCTLKGTIETCRLSPNQMTSHQYILQGLDGATPHSLKRTLEICDDMFRQERFNVFGIGQSPGSLQTCLDICEDLTIDISVVQQHYWPDRRRDVEEIILPITKERRVRLEAVVEAEWAQDRKLGLTWLSRHSSLQILPWVRARDAIVFNSYAMDRDLASCLTGRPLAASELQRLEKNNDLLQTSESC